MIGIKLLVLLAALAWVSGMEWLVGLLLLFILVLNIGIFLTVGGVSRSRHKKQKYHPI